MAIEEKVIQPDSVNPPEQPVAETPSPPQAPDLSSVKAEDEAKLAAARKEAAEAEEKFKGIKGKLDDVYKQKEEKRTKDLEEQGQWKTLWEEANKTAQEKEQQPYLQYSFVTFLVTMTKFVLHLSHQDY